MKFFLCILGALSFVAVGTLPKGQFIAQVLCCMTGCICYGILVIVEAIEKLKK